MQPQPTIHNPNHAVGKTHADLGAGFSSVQGKGIYVTFQWDMIRIDSSDPEQNGKRVKRLRLIKQPIGDPSTAASSYITPEEAANQFPEQWEYFTKYGDMPVSGTALSELPGISVSQIQLMQLSGLRSIEDVLSVGDEVIAKIGIDGRHVSNVAKEWDAKRKENAEAIDYAEAKASFDSALQTEREHTKRLEAENGALAARLEVLEKMLNAGGGGGAPADMSPVSPSGYDEGPDIDDTPNPLADGDGRMDDPLAD